MCLNKCQHQNARNQPKRSTQSLSKINLYLIWEPCPKGQERTANYCVKKLSSYKKDKVEWVRTVSPNKKTRITIVCPK